MTVIDLQVLDDSNISKRSKQMYRHTIIEVNKKLGFDSDSLYYIDSDWYLENFERVVEAIQSLWKINVRRDLSTRLNHIQKIFYYGSPEQLIRFRNLSIKACDKLPTISNAVRTTIDWNDLKVLLYNHSKNRDNPFPLRMVYLLYSYGYVYRPHEFIEMSVKDIECLNYLDLDTGYMKIGITKTGKERSVTISSELLYDIKELRGEYYNYQFYEPLIPQSNGEYYSRTYAIRPPEGIPNIHQIRHSYETYIYSSSNTVEQANIQSEALGHSAHTAMDIYVDLVDSCHPKLHPFVVMDGADSLLEKSVKNFLKTYKPVQIDKNDSNIVGVDFKSIREHFKTYKVKDLESIVSNVIGKPPVTKLSTTVRRKGWVL